MSSLDTGQRGPLLSIAFSGAPIANAIIALSVRPLAGSLSSLRCQFAAGILLAAVGGCMATLYKPSPAKNAGPPPSQSDILEPLGAP